MGCTIHWKWPVQVNLSIDILPRNAKLSSIWRGNEVIFGSGVTSNFWLFFYKAPVKENQQIHSNPQRQGANLRFNHK